MQGYITITEYAGRQGVSRQAVHNWLRRLGMRPHRIAGLSLLSPADCRKLTAGRQENGRPKKTVDKAEPAA